MYSVIGIGLALGMIGLGVLGMLGSGIQSVLKGKQDLKKIISFIVPFAVFGIALGISGDAADAGIATMMFMMAAMMLFIVLTGLRSTFNF